MRIFLLTLEWPPYGGGIGTYMHNLATGLVGLGHEVTVMTHDKSPERLDGVRVVEVPVPDEKGRFAKAALRWRWEPHYTWSKRAWEKFAGMDAHDGYDIMETAEYGAWARHFIGRVDMPVVVRCHTPAHGVRELSADGQAAMTMPWWLKCEDKMEQWQTTYADAISAPSHALANHVSLSWGIASSRIAVFPNPVDARMFHPNGGWVSRRKEVLYVGRLQYNKGVLDLVDASIPLLRGHPEMTLRLVGPDIRMPAHMNGAGCMTSEAIMARTPAAQRGQLSITGRVSLAELITAQQKAMCAAVPSRGFESFSYTMAEHMACGTAVVATHSGGPTEIIRDGEDGLLVPPGDTWALTDALKRLAENPEMCQEIGHKARAKVEEQFAIPVVVPRIVEWYERVIRAYGGTRTI